MKHHQTRVIRKLVSLTLAFLLLHGHLALFPQDQRRDRLEGLFHWAAGDYQNGKYREVTRNLELLLSYFDEDKNKSENTKDQILKGQIYLLLGATFEQLGQVKKATENYRLSKEIFEKQQVEMNIEGLDFTFLAEYQRIVLENKTPVPGKKQGIIAKPAFKPKKKRLSPLWFIGSVVLVGGVIAALLLSKKQPEVIEFDANYDTQVLGIEWVQVPPYLFWMGDNFGEGEADELPVHSVTLNTYYISKHEVTFAQYDTFCRETQRSLPPDNGWGRGNRPVIYVSWSDANAFCNWLFQKTGKNITLPSEAQWEKAARGSEQSPPRYPWGNSPPDCNKVNYNCDLQTHPVGSHPEGVSPYGVHDMAGNVSEWCRDNYNSQYYSSSPSHNPLYTTNTYPYNVIYVIRGGSWDSSQSIGIRAADRGSMSHLIDSRGPSLGFRLIRQ